MRRTIKFFDIELDVEFDFQPEEEAVMYYSDGSGYPGCAASIDNITVMYEGEDVTDLFSNKGITEIEDKIWGLLSNEEPPEDDRD